jgi:hypothetical protein
VVASGFTNERVARWVLLALFTALALAAVLRHEMWRDELHAWNAVIGAGSPLEAARNVSR